MKSRKLQQWLQCHVVSSSNATDAADVQRLAFVITFPKKQVEHLFDSELPNIFFFCRHLWLSRKLNESRATVAVLRRPCHLRSSCSTQMARNYDTNLTAASVNSRRCRERAPWSDRRKRSLRAARSVCAAASPDTRCIRSMANAAHTRTRRGGELCEAALLDARVRGNGAVNVWPEAARFGFPVPLPSVSALARVLMCCWCWAPLPGPPRMVEKKRSAYLVPCPGTTTETKAAPGSGWERRRLTGAKAPTA